MIDFDKNLQRIIRSSHQQYRENYFSKYLSSTQMKFQSRIFNCVIFWKIYVEIQLLFFYEQNSNIFRSRSICSSKNACYLCNLLIKIHDKFHIFKTHDKFHDKWILSTWSINEFFFNEYIFSMIKRFNVALKIQILHTLNHKRLSCQHSNKNVLFLHKFWSSTSTLSKAYIKHFTANASNRIYDDIFKNQKELSFKNFVFIDMNSSEFASNDNLLIIAMPCVKRNTSTVQHRSEERHASMKPSRSIART